MHAARVVEVGTTTQHEGEEYWLEGRREEKEVSKGKWKEGRKKEVSISCDIG